MKLIFLFKRKKTLCHFVPNWHNCQNKTIVFEPAIKKVSIFNKKCP